MRREEGTVKTMCRVRIAVGTNSGRREGWIKHVTNVDNSKTNGYAFGGMFLNAGSLVDMPEGAVLVCCDPEGSVKNNYKSGSVRIVRRSGEFTDATERVFSVTDWRDDFLTLRDEVGRLLATETDNAPVSDSVDLSAVSDAQIVAEAKRRNLIPA